MKKGDFIILFILILITFITGFMVKNMGDSSKNLTAVIKVDGKLYKEIKLTDNYNNFIEIKSPFGYNKIRIVGKSVIMVDSSCKDKDCLKAEKITKPFQSIVCLPNRFIVYLKGDSNFDYVSY